MSKYLKIEDIKNVLIELSESDKRLECETTMNIIKALGDLPTIEVSEDAISREYLEEQLQQIEDITAMAHIDLGEDPYDGTEEITMPISTVRKIFKNAPSVVPSRAEGEWEVKERDSYFGKKIVLTCSECGDEFSVTESEYPNERYCRYCGAKMKGAE